MILRKGFAFCSSAIFMSFFEKLTERGAGLLYAAKANWPPSYRAASWAVLLLSEAREFDASAPGELQRATMAHMANAKLPVALACALGEAVLRLAFGLVSAVSAVGCSAMAGIALPGWHQRQSLPFVHVPAL